MHLILFPAHQERQAKACEDWDADASEACRRYCQPTVNRAVRAKEGNDVSDSEQYPIYYHFHVLVGHLRRFTVGVNNIDQCFYVLGTLVELFEVAFESRSNFAPLWIPTTRIVCNYWGMCSLDIVLASSLILVDQAWLEAPKERININHTVRVFIEHSLSCATLDNIQKLFVRVDALHTVLPFFCIPDKIDR